jgi:hypothetical protein
MSVEIDPTLCFVVMPLTTQFEEIYEDIVKPTAESLGLGCQHAGEIFGARLIMDDIWDRLERARVVVAELTGRNPNVFYEVGYAHCLDKGRVILVTQSIDDVPFDLRGFRCVEYGLGPRGLDKLRGSLKGMMEAVLAEEPRSLRPASRTAETSAEPDDRVVAAIDLYEALGAFDREARLQLTAAILWPRLVAAVKAKSRNVAAILTSCTPVRVEEDTLVLRAPSRFHKEKVESKPAKDLVEDEVEKVIGARLVVRCE